MSYSIVLLPPVTAENERGPLGRRDLGTINFVSATEDPDLGFPQGFDSGHLSLPHVVIKALHQQTRLAIRHAPQ
jgi:hypothetical protein